ncbi:MAG: orotidine-5'-phosphate decarboxylase [Chthoniobacterales bacterium]
MKSHGNADQARERLIVALDVETATDAFALVSTLKGEISWFKIGLQLFTSAGPSIIRKIADSGARIFLDLKLHDIPNTVAKAVGAAGAHKVQMLSIHLSGGRAMIEAAVTAKPENLTLLGVTVLTSCDTETLRETGISATPREQVLRLAELGRQCGIDALVASPQEIEPLRGKFGASMKIIAPGIRPGWSDADDQKRVMTPREAIEKGADYIVIGRPITAHSDPLAAVRKIVADL